MNDSVRVAIVGGGHNALVAATVLARAGLRVTVVERLDQLGGAAVSSEIFDGVAAKLSRYSYLVSLFPKQLINALGLNLTLASRSTASYTPYADQGLLVETNPGALTANSFRSLTGGDTEFDAWRKFYREVSTVAAAIWPTLLGPLPHIGDIRDQVEMAIWTDLVETAIGTALERRFSHDLVRGVIGTDALIGTFATLKDESLLENRCFLYHLTGNGTGEWRVPVGGMGAVSAELERVARAAGVQVRTSAEVSQIDVDSAGVRLAGEGFDIEADYLLSGVAPWTLAQLLGQPQAPKPQGAQLKINLLVDRLPQLRSGIDPAIAFAGTLHLNESYAELETAHAQAAAGMVPDTIPGEIYCHTLTDPSILAESLRASGAHTLTYFGLHLPPAVFESPGAKELAVARAVAGLDAVLHEPLASVLSRDRDGRPCLEAKTPQEIEAELGMPGGHIFHGDLQWPWLEEHERASDPAHRWGVATDWARILLCGSGARRGGAVSGIAGHNAAHALLEVLGLGRVG